MSLLSAVRALRARELFVPEILQTSMMDCGPVALKSVFDGYRRPINLERLRERCQTDVDGTSISAMHETANRLGLDVTQILVPKDSLLLPEAACLPAITLLASPGGLLHFVTVWNEIGGRIQVMDPARGRIWMRGEELLSRVATPTLKLPNARWRTWAGGRDFAKPLLAKMRRCGFDREEAERLLVSAREDPSFESLAALDAATRMVRALIDGGALRRGAGSRRLLTRAFEIDRVAERPSIPEVYWICRPAQIEAHVAVTGALLLCVAGVKDGEGVADSLAAHDTVPETSAIDAARLSVPEALDSRRSLAAHASRAEPELVDPRGVRAGPVIAREVIEELRAPTVRPYRIFGRMLWEDSRLAVVLVGGLLVLGMTTSVLDALLMRGVSDLIGRMNLIAHRLVAVAAVAVFLVLSLLLDLAQAHLVQRLARGLEVRLRVAFLEKLPRLEDRYFRSRPISDMASRAHLLQTLRGIPRFAVDLGSGVLRLLTTAGVLVWLEPRLWKLAAALLALCLSMPLVASRLLDEALARMRTLGGALFRFYLDALLGVVPIRVHGAERAVRREHEAILTEWVRSSLAVEGRTLAVRTVERLVGTMVAVAIVVLFVRSGGDLRALLLVALFAQRLPSEAEALVNVVRRYPLLKHDALRLFEPLAASESGPIDVLPRRPESERPGVDIAFREVTAVAGGRRIVSGVTLAIPCGSHVAIVGASGAGKSSLVSILLGWLLVTEGQVLIDGSTLDAQQQVLLRTETAWVDPAVQLWNTTLLENLLYGHDDDGLAHVEEALHRADLLEVIEHLPEGLQSALGESGARVSGGQGQRARFGRALLKRSARLVILDEPFRGLERDKRRELLRRARALWSGATLLLVTHDVRDTVEMDRALVVQDGSVIEDGAPADLLSRDTEYRRLVEGDRSALSEVWGRPEWRRLRVSEGTLVEQGRAEVVS